jgi:hypothetical protein
VVASNYLFCERLMLTTDLRGHLKVTGSPEQAHTPSSGCPARLKDPSGFCTPSTNALTLTILAVKQ